MGSTKVYITETTDPWFNLATEDWLFQEMDPEDEILYLWRNAPTVVIGRYQNPWKECDLKAMEADGVLLSRRQSGGGAVYHDLGNTNFTFFSGRRTYDKARNNRIITDALSSFGIHAEPSGRNDIVVEERKISGSAFKLTAQKAFHHGTLLINADLTRLLSYLTPGKRKLMAKGIESVSSRVANLTEFSPDISHESLSNTVVESFFKFCSTPERTVEYLNYETLQKIPHLQSYYDMMKDWNWRFGRTPEFTHHLSTRFSWGEVELYVIVNRGIITDITVFTDTLHPEVVEKLHAALKGKPYTVQALKEAAGKASSEPADAEKQVIETLHWIAAEI